MMQLLEHMQYENNNNNNNKSNISVTKKRKHENSSQNEWFVVISNTCYPYQIFALTLLCSNKSLLRLLNQLLISCYRLLSPTVSTEQAKESFLIPWYDNTHAVIMFTLCSLLLAGHQLLQSCTLLLKRTGTVMCIQRRISLVSNVCQMERYLQCCKS
jgi:hypothetical protein